MNKALNRNMLMDKCKKKSNQKNEGIKRERGKYKGMSDEDKENAKWK